MNNTHMEIPVMHCFDNNYVIPAAVSFSSMLSHADPRYTYKLYVLHSDITVQNQKKLSELVVEYKNASLEFVDMNHRLNDIWNSCHTDRGHLRKELLYKLLAPSLFPQYEKLIITDVDVVFLGDIAPSYFALNEHPEAYYAGVRQINPKGTFLRDYYNNTYRRQIDSEEFDQLKICGGYLVANLALLRRDGMEAVMIDCLRKNIATLFQPEQDVINYCCRDKQISYLPLDYVVCSYMYDLCEEPCVCASDPFYTYREMQEAMAHPVQLHYATGKKPWTHPDSTKAELWFDEMKNTSFQVDYDRQVQVRAAHGKLSDCPCIEWRVDAPGACPKKASVLCCAYNHERFVEAALEGILRQKTNFAYEVIVVDDASTDRTPEIITRFQEKYPDKMTKVILRGENIGIGENYYDALTRVEGEYLAICDGDDCWTDENKLQMQVDFLEQNPKYTIVCTDFTSHYVDETARPDEPFHVVQYIGARKECYTLQDLMHSRFIASCTAMLRWQLRDNVPVFLRHYQVIDFPLTLIHAAMGYIGVMERCTARYNVHQAGVSSDGGTDVVSQSMVLIREVNQFLDFRLTKLQEEYFMGVKPVDEKLSASLGRKLYHIYRNVLPVPMQEFFCRLIPRKLYAKIKIFLNR